MLNILLLFFSFTVSAGWSPASLKIAQEMNQKYSGIGDGYLMTAWGGWHRMWSWSSVKGKMVEVKTTGTRSGKVDIYLSQAEGVKPLYLLFPGIFGEPKQRITEHFIQMLESFGGHVVVIPNLLAMGWVKDHPLYGDDPFETELLITQDIWKYVTEKIGEKNISKTHVLGESLGTLMASAWAAHKKNPSLTLFAPPLELDYALGKIDLYVSSLYPVWQQCGTFKTLPLFIKYFILNPTPKGIQPEEAQCLSAWTAVKGFQGALKKVYEAHAQKELGPATFTYFFENYREPLWKTIQGKNQKLHLAFWFRQLKQSAPDLDLQILSSKDDFLNQGLDWEEWKKKNEIRDNEVILLDWGGHSGALATSEIITILRDEFVNQ